MKRTSLIAIMFMLVSAIAQDVSAQATQSPPEKLPWTLREHYTFSGGVLRMDYAKDNAEWRIKMYQEDTAEARMHPELIIRDVGFSIELSDGRVLTNDMLSYGGETVFTREPYNDDFLGAGTTYSVAFVPMDGLLVEHTFLLIKTWNFLRLSVKVTNQGGAPVGISKITSANIVPGNVMGLSDNALVSMRNLNFRGPYPVYTSDGPPTSLRIYDPERAIIIQMSLLPTGRARSGFQVTPGSTQKYGPFESVYAPEKVLQPGEVLEADPLFFSLGVIPAVAEAQYAYILLHSCAPTVSDAYPRAWVTVPDTENLSTLRAEAANAKASGIHHALIPAGWEGRPGTLEGGTPRYPKNIAEAARSLRDAGTTPGLTVDPLLSHGGGSSWTAQSVDGQQWVNLNAPDGRGFAVSRMRKLIEMGFAFLVIEPSRITDDVLGTFGMTRAEADAYAFGVALEAASGGRAIVMPASAARLAVARDDLLEAASSIVQLRKWDVGMSPITLIMDSRTSLDAETMLALRLYNGPMEFLGAPPRALQASVTEVLNRPWPKMHPQDVSRRVPLVWLSAYSSLYDGSIGESIAAFTGASAWEMTAFEDYNGALPEPVLWQPVEDRIALLRDGRIPPSGRLAAFGWIQGATHPVLAGVSNNAALGLDCLKRCAWDAGSLTLKGEFQSLNKGTAYFFVPPSYVISSAQVSGKTVRPGLEGSWVMLTLDAGGGAFELVFSRR